MNHFLAGKTGNYWVTIFEKTYKKQREHMFEYSLKMPELIAFRANLREVVKWLFRHL